MSRTRFDGSHLKAVVFDVDGTLYRQGRLRRKMLVRLLAMLAARPVAGWQTIRVLRAYRRAQEGLRDAAASDGVAAAQIRLTCERTNVSREVVVACVSRWMEREPLALMAQCVQPGVLEFLRACKARGLRLGALSDYPAEAKLHALGLIDLFDIVLCAQAPDINVFKPNPRGLVVAIERLGAAGSQSLYVGDRADVDAPTAAAACVRCAILTRRRRPKASDSHIQVAGYSELSDVLWR